MTKLQNKVALKIKVTLYVGLTVMKNYNILSLLAFQHMSCYFVVVILNVLLLSYFIPLVSMSL